MKSLVAHYKNVFPGGRVEFTEDRLDAYDEKGVHRIALRVGGGGVLLDKGEEFGATDKHDLSPIPKNTRVHKLTVDGRLTLDEEAAERKEVAKNIAYQGKIPSIAQLEKEGFEFDAKGNVLLLGQK